jgi:hypothetical protein
MKIKTSITIDLPDDILESLMTTAYESGGYGIGYWFAATHVERDAALNVVKLVGIDCEADSKEDHIADHKKLWVIDAKVIEKGLKKAIRDNYKNVMEALGSEAPECQLDAADADTIIQLGLFGEIVYA